MHTFFKQLTYPNLISVIFKNLECRLHLVRVRDIEPISKFLSELTRLLQGQMFDKFFIIFGTKFLRSIYKSSASPFDIFYVFVCLSTYLLVGPFRCVQSSIPLNVGLFAKISTFGPLEILRLKRFDLYLKKLRDSITYFSHFVPLCQMKAKLSKII